MSIPTRRSNSCRVVLRRVHRRDISYANLVDDHTVSVCDLHGSFVPRPLFLLSHCCIFSSLALSLWNALQLALNVLGVYQGYDGVKS